jgi:hypothetical protein
MVIQYSEKGVMLPGGADDPHATAGEWTYAMKDPESRVFTHHSHRVLVPDTFQVTRIAISTEDYSGQKAKILKFSWGPQKKQVEIWSHRSLRARVTTGRAMQIYEEPGAYVLMSGSD